MQTILIVAAAWSVIAATGWLVLAPLDRSSRDALLPAAPLFGVVLLVVVLHATTLAVSVRSGLLVVAAVLGGLAVVAFRRDPTWWRPSRAAMATAALTAACAVVPAIWALGPSLAVGDSAVIQPSDNNDAFYYVTVASWLQDNPATDVPMIGATPEDPGVPPSYAPARAQLTLDLRIGQELTHAALTTVMGLEVEGTWYPVTALWVLLLPASGVAAARFLRLHLVTGLALGTLTSVSALVVFQLSAQNSDSLLGTALVPLALGAVLRAVGRDPLVPRALAGLALSALVGTYTEFVPLIGPALVVAVLLRPCRDMVAALRSAVVVLAFALAAAPLVWVRAVRSLLFLGGIEADNFPSAFHQAPLHVIAGRFLGIAGFDAPTVSISLLLVLVAFVVVGLVAAVALTGRRWFYAALLLVGLLLAVYMVTVRERPYTQQRVVQLWLPLVLLVTAAGWDRLWRIVRERGATGSGRRRRRPARRPIAVAAAGLTGAGVFIVGNGVVVHDRELAAKARERHVGPEFAQAAGWVRELGGDEGDEAAVLVADFFSQLWITDALRDETEVSYPSLHPSYQYQLSYWDGNIRRWLLTDRRGIRTVDRGVVVRKNARFALLDLSRGRAVVAVSADVFGQNSYLVLDSARGPSEVGLVGTTRARAETDVAPSPGYGDPVDPDELRPGTTVLRLELDDGWVRIVLSDSEEIFVLQSVRFG